MSNCGVREVPTSPTAGDDESPGRPADGTRAGAYNYVRRNVAGVQREWWFHRSGCRAWFLAERDTRTNVVLLTTLPDAPDSPASSARRADRPRAAAHVHVRRRVRAAYAGDTIVSALYAAGQRTFSRSFKYHRPRGELCGCGQCANSLFHVDGAPGIRGCAQRVRDGMHVEHQNAWPSLAFDVRRVTDLIGGPFTPPGFYYKTFIRPRRLWPFYERVLRGAAGLGRLPADRRSERAWRSEYRRRHCDVLVIGAGSRG